jgi:ERCC4-type nuclease
MILLDSRIGSHELLRFFTPFDITVESTQLNSGDACWAGSGPNGDCMIGIERKRITDLVQSMREKRLAGLQLPRMMKDYDFIYLVVEGYFRPGDRGELEQLVKRGSRSEWRSLGMSYREMDNHLSTLELKCGVVVRRTSSPQETVNLIVNLYKWWEKGWDKHKSHHVIYNPLPQSLVHSRKASYRSPEEEVRRKYGELAVVVWRMASQLDGLDTKAELVAAHFRRPRRMYRATVDDWTEIKGIGKKLAVKYAEIFGK